MNHDVSANPALLKLMLARCGIAGPHNVAGFQELVLDGEIPARARFDPQSPISLTAGSGDAQSTLRIDGVSIPVRLASTPEFAVRRNARGVALGDIADMRGGYATVELGGGCGLAAPRRACAFCMGRELTEKAGELWPVDEVVEALRAAFEEGDAEFVHFQLGYFPGDDAGLQVLKPYLDAVRRHFDTIIAVTMHPPAAPRGVEAAYAGGVDVISYNLEAADEASMRRWLPGRARFFGRPRYLDALRHAARIFPGGAVWSELMLDLASETAVAEAIGDLAAMNVVPLLAVSAQPRRELDFTRAAPLLAHLFDAVFNAGLSMTWARDLPGAITPLEARHFVPDPPQMPLLMHQLARNRLGALTTRSLARLRRRLRVKRVRASFDSSHL
jgi:hypothetical protein